jgi:hypothetical protein
VPDDGVQWGDLNIWFPPQIEKEPEQPLNGMVQRVLTTLSCIFGEDRIQLCERFKSQLLDTLETRSEGEMVLFNQQVHRTYHSCTFGG